MTLAAQIARLTAQLERMEKRHREQEGRIRTRLTHLTIRQWREAERGRGTR